ncbi:MULTISPECIES: hypothetical protein [Streptomycetaceae]|uniref:hypothetical protein n=1 Tax=Streptomycetaceae TaxID=2062 RepID=UPI000213FCB6|nr:MULTISPECIES: hypothetical protein [Streptomycetaceae]MYS60616.1 hypothetical protein [Streptomyces sp. SID5468]CCB76422.1 conserved protein of unknown function [Streptantibioticus cattleyicolor NRRL 8057 = DSM 46488]
MTRLNNVLGRPDGTAVLAQDRYVMTKVSQAKRGALLGVVERSWKRFGYRIESVNPSKIVPAIFAVTPDGYGVNIQVGVEGNVSFEVGSPSFPYSEDSEAYDSGGLEPDTMPDVDDPFWSR